MKHLTFSGAKRGMVVLALLLVQQSLASEQVQDDLIFCGCSIIRRAFMTDAALLYEAQTGQHVEVLGGGAMHGIRMAAAQEVDMGGSCRPPLSDLFEEERPLQVYHVGWDALVFITHPSNPVSNLSLQQAKDILVGNIINWSELGGPDARIVCAFRDQDLELGGKFSGVGYMTRLLLFNDSQQDFTESALFYKHSALVEEAVESIPFSLAVTGVSSARHRSVKTLRLDGMKAGVQEIASGDYPLFRPLYLSIQPDCRKDVRDFVQWMLGPVGQGVLEKRQTVTLAQGRTLAKHFRHWPQVSIENRTSTGK